MPFSKGDPNINRKGRPPRAWSMSDLIEDALEELDQDQGMTYKVIVAKKLATMAAGGDLLAIKEINDRIDGKPKQAIDHTTNGKDLPTPLLATLDVPNNNGSEETEDTE